MLLKTSFISTDIFYVKTSIYKFCRKTYIQSLANYRIKTIVRIIIIFQGCKVRRVNKHRYTDNILFSTMGL